MKKRSFLLLIGIGLIIHISAQQPASPDIIYGELFKQVQLQKVFPDGKTFVDCTPKRKVRDIMYDYGLSNPGGEQLKKFVEDNFNQPVPPPVLNYITKETDVVTHINNLWGVLQREADKPVEGSSLLPLPNSYIVPGGRFREIYYWDSYFTMLGLKESGRTDIIENMIDNFAFLINTYGHIPNGNRTYYLSRSQPPFFSMMVDLLAGIKGKGVYKKYLTPLQKEYDYWMEGSANLKAGGHFKRIVKLKNGVVLNRYWDESATPRPESYKEDYETAEKIASEKMMTMRFANKEAMDKFKLSSLEESYHHLRAGAASGLDFSSRWFADQKNITTIQTTDIIPVDLNCLLLNLEHALAKAYKEAGNEKMQIKMNAMALKRESVFRYLFQSTAIQFFSDYNFKTGKTTDIPCASSLMILNFLSEPNPEGIKSLGKAAAVFVKKYLLQAGGIQTTPNNTGQQWDAPNGWAPLQWISISALEHSGQKELAKDIATRWIKLNVDVFNRTGKLMEKYNVVDTHLEAGGGEYSGQDGFGWTNGVLLALIKKYGMKNKE